MTQEIAWGGHPKVIEFLKGLGVDTKNYKRVIIDIKYNELVFVYEERSIDFDSLDVNLLSGLKLEVKKVSEL